MKKLLKNQAIYFYYLIKNRFLLFMVLLFLMELILFIQTKNNPHNILLNYFFRGVSFEELKQQQVVFPVLWFSFFIIPILIINDTFLELWKSFSLHLRGLKYKKKDFGIINLCLLGGLSVFYFILSMGMIMMSIQKNSFQIASYSNLESFFIFSVCLFFNLLIILILNMILSLYSVPLSLMFSCLYLLFAIYSKNNIFLNSSMISRLNSINVWTDLVVMVCSILFLILIYLKLYPKREIN